MSVEDSLTKKEQEAIADFERLAKKMAEISLDICGIEQSQCREEGFFR